MPNLVLLFASHRLFQFQLLLSVLILLHMELSKSLKILPNNHNPRATEYVEEMIQFIQVLINQNLAYEMNGNIFFI